MSRLVALAFACTLGAVTTSQAQVVNTYTENQAGPNQLPYGLPVPRPIESLTPVDGFRSYASLDARLQGLEELCVVASEPAYRAGFLAALDDTDEQHSVARLLRSERRVHVAKQQLWACVLGMHLRAQLEHAVGGQLRVHQGRGIREQA